MADTDFWQAIGAEERLFLVVCLMLATQRPRGVHFGGGLATLQLGQLVASLESLARHTGLSLRKVRPAITKLEQWGILTRKPTRHGTLFRIENWEDMGVAFPEATHETADSSCHCLNTGSDQHGARGTRRCGRRVG
jgi:hypothetical protein